MLSTYLTVTYNPPQDILTTQLDALQKQPVIIVDNGSEQSILNIIEAWVNALPNQRKLIKLKQNSGIAFAQNRGIELALEQGCEFVLLLDHDSIPEFDLLNILVSSAKTKLKDGEKLAAVGARLIDPRSEKEIGFATMMNGYWQTYRCTDTQQLILCEFLNSAGSLIYLPAWKTIGCFDESFFIDHVETDWYMRARAKQFKVYGSSQGVLQHHMGDAIVNFWFFGWRSMPHRSPKRHYTIVRNSLWMYRRDYVPLSWKLNNFAKLIFTLVYFSLFDEEKTLQFRLIILGFYHGISIKKFSIHNDN